MQRGGGRGREVTPVPPASPRPCRPRQWLSFLMTISTPCWRSCARRIRFLFFRSSTWPGAGDTHRVKASMDSPTPPPLHRTRPPRLPHLLPQDLVVHLELVEALQLLGEAVVALPQLLDVVAGFGEDPTFALGEGMGQGG